MLNLFRAEWIKIMGNRWVTAFLILIFPVGMFAFVLVMSVLIVLVPGARDQSGTESLGLDHAEWTDQALEAWTIPKAC